MHTAGNKVKLQKKQIIAKECKNISPKLQIYRIIERINGIYCDNIFPSNCLLIILVQPSGSIHTKGHLVFDIM